jgi:hypothetical protein
LRFTIFARFVRPAGMARQQCGDVRRQLDHPADDN